MLKTMLKTQVSPDTRLAFKAKAIEAGYTEASLQRLLIESFVKQNPSKQIEMPAATETKNNFLSVILNARMKAELKKRAAENRMSLSSYVVSLLKAHLSQQASFTEPELEVLRRSNSELTACGRNVNQISRALNTSLDNAHLVKAEEMQQLATLIKMNRDHTRSLIRKNMAGWGVEP